MFNMYKNGLKVAETEEKKYTFDGLKPKTTYKLGVSRVENNKESEIIELEVTTQELEKPVAPTNVRAVEIEANSFVLMWDPAPNGTYKVHLDGYVKFDNVTDNMVRLDGLTPNTEYQASVMTVLNGMESMPQLVNVKTLDVAPVEPHSLKVIGKGDTFITVQWDSTLPIGTGVYNLYLDNEPLMQDLQVREYTIRKLQPSTEYKICLCGVDEQGNESPKITIYETTNAAVGEDEPTLDAELVNIIKNGSFEAFTGRYPDSYENPREVTSGEESNDLIVVPNTEWKTHGNQSITMSVNKDAKDGMQLLMQRIKLMPGYYVAALDYKMPLPVDISGEGEETKYKHALILHALSHSQSVYGGEGVLYVASEVNGINEIEVVANIYIADYGSEFDVTATVDSLRLYKVNKDMHDYINAGKMSDARFKEVFAYVDSTATTKSIDVEQYHTGAGWYDLPTGDKVRGKENAEEIMKSVDEI